MRTLVCLEAREGGVVYQRLDEQVSLREALAQCGLLTPSLDDALIAATRNDVTAEEHHFRARH